jgi:hypothetical protein
MPRLLFFLACERAVVSQEDNSLSVISVISDVSASLPFPPDGPIPANASMPFRWYLVSGWKRDPNGPAFEQRVVFQASDGEVLLSANLFFEMGQDVIRGIVGFKGFPVGRPGDCRAVLYLRSDGEWNEVATVPITVKTVPLQDARNQQDPEQKSIYFEPIGKSQ